MSAYVIVQGRVIDQEKMNEYGAAAGPTVAAHGGELVCRGPAAILAGDTAYTMAVVLKFPDTQAAQNWYHSPEYQTLIPTREAALDSVFVVVEG